jgi:hypothetical protein
VLNVPASAAIGTPSARVPVAALHANGERKCGDHGMGNIHQHGASLQVKSTLLSKRLRLRIIGIGLIIPRYRRFA